MRRESVDRDLVDTSIREHGVASISEIQLGLVEPDGTINIVPSDARVLHSRHRVRFQRRA